LCFFVQNQPKQPKLHFCHFLIFLIFLPFFATFWDRKWSKNRNLTKYLKNSEKSEKSCLYQKNVVLVEKIRFWTLKTPKTRFLAKNCIFNQKNQNFPKISKFSDRKIFFFRKNDFFFFFTHVIKNNLKKPKMSPKLDF
jgi:hypothetical protein